MSSLSRTVRQAGAEDLLLESGAQLHACPIEYPGQRIPLPVPGLHTASGARLQHDGRRLVRFQLPEGRTIRVIVHACDVQQPTLSLSLSVVSLSWCGGVVFELPRVHFSLLTEFKHNTAKHSCTRKIVCSSSKGS